MLPIDQFEFHHRLEDTPGAALVMFSAPSCGQCRHLEKMLERVSALCPDLKLFKIDAQREAALVHELEVFHLPSLFLFRDGHFHCELQGEASPQALAMAVERALAWPAEEAP